MRTILKSAIAVCAVLLTVAATGAIQAQDTRGTWFPQTNPAPLSPWLQMERRSTSELDTFNQFVRPRIEMENQLMAQRRELNRQKDRQSQLQDEVTQYRNADYRITGEATATGKKASYRNYMHYYNRR